ncbi:MAG: hypothetical protein H0X24_23635 [Ktedonobacterales bacterium]|nr:hypothetical protein [Ktedonobacterales bacterium]
MSHNNRAPRPRSSSLVPFMRGIVHNLPFVMLAAAIAAVAFAVGGISGGAPTGSAASSPGTDGWIALRGQSTYAIIAAAQQSPLFHVNRGGTGDYLHDLSHLGTPVMVHGIPGPHPVVLSDYDIIPVLDRNGNAVGAVVAVLNPNHTALRVQSIDTYTTPHPHGAIARMTQGQAVTVMQAQRRQTLVGATQPQLAYFPIDQHALDTGTLDWNSGGILPDDPIWQFPASNGAGYVVGTDNSVHPISALPFAP